MHGSSEEAQHRDRRGGHAHGHGHHEPASPVSPRVRRLLTALLLPCAVAVVTGVLVLYPWGDHQRTGADIGLRQVPVKGDVIAVSTGACVAGGTTPVSPGAPPNGRPGQLGDPDQAGGCLMVTVTMTEGAAAGHSITKPVPIEPSTPRFAVGDHVVLAYSGGTAGNPDSYELVDFQRGPPLVVLAVLFALAVLVLGRWQGVAALGALLLSFVVLLAFVFPAVLAGKDPVWVAVVGAGLIMFVVLYLTHGFSARTSTAVLGTAVSLALIGVLGTAFSAVTKLTGLDEDTANLIALLGHGIDSRGLLLAGVVIGALGVLDDVTVTQTSAVWELRRANPALHWRQLYAAGSRIGRDHVSSAVNTLVMAYAGASLPLLLAYSVAGRSLGEIVTAQAVAQEVVRTLVGSIGLVASVPLTTLLAALVACQEKAQPPDPSSPTQSSPGPTAGPAAFAGIDDDITRPLPALRRGVVPVSRP